MINCEDLYVLFRLIITKKERKTGYKSKIEESSMGLKPLF